MPYNDSTNIYTNTRFIVDVNGGTPYQSIQSAIDAALAEALPATIIIRPGTYTEDLILRSTIDLKGETYDQIIIAGTHTPPAAGSIKFYDIKFTDATDVLNSAVAGTTTILFSHCDFDLTNGYVCNLTNWTGALAFEYCTDGSTLNGVVTNTATATVLIRDSQIGSGGNVFRVDGILDVYGATIACPITLTGAATSQIYGGSLLEDTLILGGTAVISISNSNLTTGADQPITHGSAGLLTLSEVSIDTANAEAIGGTGTIQMASTSFVDSDVIADLVTVNEDSFLHTPEVVANNIIRQMFSGHYEWGGAGNYYSTAGTTFTLLRAGVGYIQSRRITWTGGQDTGALTKGNTYFVYIDATGTIGSTTTRNVTLFQDTIVLFEVLYDNDTPANAIVVREDHPYDFPSATSEWGHDVIGAVIANINNGANITLQGTKAIQIVGADKLEDHGLQTDIPDSGGAAVTFNFMFTDGAGKWVIDSAANTFASEYNNGGVVAALGGNKYGVFRLYVSKDDLNTATPQYFAVLDDAQYNNLTAANTAIALDTPANATAELAELELTQLGFVIKEQSSDNIVNVVIEKETARTTFTSSGTNQASLILTDVTNFDGWLSATDTTVQAALETLDELGNSAAFLAHNSADDANQTGNGAVVTVDFDTELYDRGADFAADTFTARVAGFYSFDVSVMMSALNGATTTSLVLVTTGASYILATVNPTACADAAGAFIVKGSIKVLMAATNTAHITLQSTGAGADNNTINGSASPYETFFAGTLEI